MSTVLQVLVSIQALILNQKPYFNEPGFARLNGSDRGEKEAQKYNENTFFLSLKTMVYTMKKPPKVGFYSSLCFEYAFTHLHYMIVMKSNFWKKISTLLA